MLKTTIVVMVIGSLAILIACAFVLVVMNRASEKVVSASVPIAVAALAGIGLVFAFAGEPTASRTFPVKVIRFKDTASPAGIPFRREHNVVFLAARLLKDRPELANDGAHVYHHLLQKALFEWIASRHAGAWDAEHLAFDTGQRLQTFGPAPGSSEASLKLTPDELQEILAGNLFAEETVFKNVGLAVPPGTRVFVHAPDREAFSEGEIRLNNPLCTLRLITQRSLGMIGIGPYRLLTSMSIDEEQERYWSEEYVVRGTVSFNRWRVGDPKLPLVKRWAIQILDGLRDEFDEQIVWREARDNFLLNRAAGSASGQVFTFNP